MLLVALLGYASLELTLAALDLMRRLAVFAVSVYHPAFSLPSSRSTLAPKSTTTTPPTPNPAERQSTQESKAKLLAAGALPRIAALLAPSAPTQLQAAAMRAMHNLALDRRARRQLARAGPVQRVARVLLLCGDPSPSPSPRGVKAEAGSAQLQPLALGLLYLASTDPAGRTEVAAAAPLQRLLDALLRTPDLRAAPELIALMANLALEPRVAEWFCAGERLGALVDRALLGGGDALALKLLRNLASAGGAGVAARLVPHVPRLAARLRASDHHRGAAVLAAADVRSEALGVLAAVCSAVPLPAADEGAAAAATAADNDHDDGTKATDGGAEAAAAWRSALPQIGGAVLDAVGSQLGGVSGSTVGAEVPPLEDDALLEAVGVIGGLAGHAHVAEDLASSGLVRFFFAPSCRF